MVRTRCLSTFLENAEELVTNPEKPWLQMDLYLNKAHADFSLNSDYFIRKAYDTIKPNHDEYELFAWTWGRARAIYWENIKQAESAPAMKKKVTETDEKEEDKSEYINFFKLNNRPLKFEFDNHAFPDKKVKGIAERIKWRQRWSSDDTTLFNEEDNYRTAIFENLGELHQKKDCSFLLGFTQKLREDYVEICLIKLEKIKHLKILQAMGLGKQY